MVKDGLKIKAVVCCKLKRFLSDTQEFESNKYN